MLCSSNQLFNSYGWNKFLLGNLPDITHNTVSCGNMRFYGHEKFHFDSQ